MVVAFSTRIRDEMSCYNIMVFVELCIVYKKIIVELKFLSKAYVFILN